MNHQHVENYFEKYISEISPKLQEIDIFIKSHPKYIFPHEVSKLLYISEEEVIQIMEEESIKNITCISFFIIMQKGSSEICKIFKRELDCGIPKTYQPHEISYIYNIEIDSVLEGCAALGKSSFNSNSLLMLFKNIPA